MKCALYIMKVRVLSMKKISRILKYSVALLQQGVPLRKALNFLFGGWLNAWNINSTLIMLIASQLSFIFI